MFRDRYAVPDTQGRLSFEHSLRPLHHDGHMRFRGHTITFGIAWARQQVMTLDKGGWLEFYPIPHGELVPTLPLPEQRNINITKLGQLIAGDRKYLPHGVEARSKSHRSSDKS